jgi:hypothetical protein
MNLIKRKMADFLNKMSKKGMEKMDPKNSCAKSLKNSDRQALLKEDIERICNEMSILEAGKIFKLATKLMSSDSTNKDMDRKEIKSMASKVLKRVEKKGGKLNLPQQCRDLLMNL